VCLVNHNTVNIHKYILMSLYTQGLNGGGGRLIYRQHLVLVIIFIVIVNYTAYCEQNHGKRRLFMNTRLNLSVLTLGKI
jgi:hypothetical protein